MVQVQIQQLVVVVMGFFNVGVQTPMLVVKVIGLRLFFPFATLLFRSESSLVIKLVAYVARKVVEGKMIFPNDIGLSTDKALMVEGEVGEHASNGLLIRAQSRSCLPGRVKVSISR